MYCVSLFLGLVVSNQQYFPAHRTGSVWKRNLAKMDAPQIPSDMIQEAGWREEMWLKKRWWRWGWWQQQWWKKGPQQRWPGWRQPRQNIVKTVCCHEIVFPFFLLLLFFVFFVFVLLSASFQRVSGLPDAALFLTYSTIFYYILSYSIQFH